MDMIRNIPWSGASQVPSLCSGLVALGAVPLAVMAGSKAASYVIGVFPSFTGMEISRFSVWTRGMSLLEISRFEVWTGGMSLVDKIMAIAAILLSCAVVSTAIGAGVGLLALHVLPIGLMTGGNCVWLATISGIISTVLAAVECMDLFNPMPIVQMAPLFQTAAESAGTLHKETRTAFGFRVADAPIRYVRV